MVKTFLCYHCRKRHLKNPRLKNQQHYCGSPKCQQARKNIWEQRKLRNDPDYRSKRQASKSEWYKKRPGHSYQADYRSSHPAYVSDNRSKQQVRNALRNASVSSGEIVKTDALIPESFTRSGFYALFPCNNASGEKIVKTDALIVQLSVIQHNTDVLLNKSP